MSFRAPLLDAVCLSDIDKGVTSAGGGGGGGGGGGAGGAETG